MKQRHFVQSSGKASNLTLTSKNISASMGSRTQSATSTQSTTAVDGSTASGDGNRNAAAAELERATGSEQTQGQFFLLARPPLTPPPFSNVMFESCKKYVRTMVVWASFWVRADYLFFWPARVALGL